MTLCCRATLSSVPRWMLPALAPLVTLLLEHVSKSMRPEVKPNESFLVETVTPTLEAVWAML